MRLTTIRPVRTRRPSSDATRSSGDQGDRDRGRVPACPDRHARRPGAAARQGLRIALDLVSPGAQVRLAPARLRVHPAKPKIGLRTTRANEMWHIDTTVIRLLDGSRADLHAVIDNFSRRILAWRVAEMFTPANSVAALVEASRTATPSETTPAVLADAGVENVNAQVDELISTGVLRQVLAFTDMKFSNSMIEAWWRSLTHQWLFLHSLDSITTVRRLVVFYVQEHNTVLDRLTTAGRKSFDEVFSSHTGERLGSVGV